MLPSFVPIGQLKKEGGLLLVNFKFGAFFLALATISIKILAVAGLLIE
jgi:hypothetical protein